MILSIINEILVNNISFIDFLSLKWNRFIFIKSNVIYEYIIYGLFGEKFIYIKSNVCYQ